MADLQANLARLLAKARGLPRVPGVYLMKDGKGRVIYVGKALCLPERVSSYFIPSTQRNQTLGPKKQPMLEVVEDFDVIECEGEWEALLAENRLIKDLHPRFNVRLTDDKTYPYLVVTLREDYPGVYITRQPGDERFKGAKVLGPFTSVHALRESVQLLQRVFRFRTCELEIAEPAAGSDPKDDPRRGFRPCLLYPIKQCTAPCAARIGRAEYRGDVERFVRFLESRRSVMLRELREEMKRAAGELRFERAAALRDQVKAIEKLDDRGSHKDGWQPEAELPEVALWSDPRKGTVALQEALGLDRPVRCVECIDIAHLQGRETVGAKVCFVDGRPLKSAYRRYLIGSTRADGDATAGDDYAAIREVVSRRYREAGQGQELYPDVIVIDGGLGQLHAAQEVFDVLDIKPPMVVSLAKKEELIYVQSRSEPLRLARNHAGLRMCQAIRDEAHRFAQAYHHLLRRKAMGTGGGRTPKA